MMSRMQPEPALTAERTPCCCALCLSHPQLYQVRQEGCHILYATSMKDELEAHCPRGEARPESLNICQSHTAQKGKS